MHAFVSFPENMRLEFMLRQRKGLLSLQEGAWDIFYRGLGLQSAALTTVAAGSSAIIGGLCCLCITYRHQSLTLTMIDRGTEKHPVKRT